MLLPALYPVVSQSRISLLLALTKILRNCGFRRGHLLANSSSKQQNCASSNLSGAGLLPSQL